MSDLQNSNPTILEQWQLPTRSTVETKTIDSDLANLQQYSVLSTPALRSETEELSAPDLINDSSDEEVEPIDAQEIFDLIANVHDPEHPLTLAQLAVVALDRINIKDTGDPNDIAEVHIEITPTITHCSLATLIGLGLRVRLERSLPPRFRIKITVTPGSHQSEHQVNKQLNDKERVTAACENEQLLKVISDMLAHC